ncbi:MAG TPA: cell division protein FtsZ [Luteibaculaceae bacterium]|nr:cell division protein FtsZ [Luteibaculaceae bacterium]
MMQFDLPKEQGSIIKVIGVGGGGTNAVNHMFRQGIRGVDFIVCNTDRQSLEASPVPVAIQLGENLTGGNGAGSIPEVGKNAAIETIDEMRALLSNQTTMVFITAGMGGGTGTGAAPIIAKLARDMGILTVGIVTVPFTFEGKKRAEQAQLGLQEMRAACDTLLVVQNDKLREIYGNMTLRDAFAKADDVLAVAARGIAEVVSIHGIINVDMNDVKTVIHNSGLAVMGSGEADGENRARQAIEQALESPLLNDNDIFGAKHVLLNITLGSDMVMMEEIFEITEYIQDSAGSETNLIWGYGIDEALGEKIRVSVVATGFEAKMQRKVSGDMAEQTKVVSVLKEEPRNQVSTDFRTPSPVSQSVEPTADEPFVVNKTTESPSLFSQDDLASDNKSNVTYYDLNDDTESVGKTSVDTNQEATPSAEAAKDRKLNTSEQQRLMEERFNRIKELNMKLRSTAGLADLEREPAIVRKNLKLNATPHSSENNVSRFTINENGEIRKGNSFLHDNVD